MYCLGSRRFDGFDQGRCHELLSTTPWAPLFDESATLCLDGDTNVLESRGGDHLFEFCNRRSAGDAPRIGGGIRRNRCRYVADRHDVGYRQPPSRCQHTERFAEHRWLVRSRLITQLDMMTSTDASSTGRCSISPKRKLTFTSPVFAAFALARSIISGVMSTPMTMSGRADLASGEESVESGATTEIEDALARSEVSDSLRVAATQT